ncbi:MAG: DegT/DnrJ/EryC1/StrS family aminotransferase, partial [Phycisphaeraceae bacterium]|nr:DegT/DnrJ/EryC1/StrS family aminotransferase [Phycisphaeraceae bacterium]
MADAMGRAFGIGTCGGGPALHIAAMAAGVEMGDEVITTPYSWGQTVACILQAGGVPVFADIDPRTLQIDPRKIEALVTPRTKAIVLVHLFGVPADMDAIMDVARRHNLLVIEDCAQAQGSRYKGKPVGSQGDLACFSIGSGKNLAAGDGGMILCDDRLLYEKALVAGMHPARTYKEVQIPEVREQISNLIYTYRINAFTAALAVKQMDRVEELNGWRRKNAQRLRELLKGVPGIRPLDLPKDLDPAWHIIPWTFVPEDFGGKVTRWQFVKTLQAEGVPIGPGYVGSPIYHRPIFQDKQWIFGKGYPWAASAENAARPYPKGLCPVAEKRCAEQDLIMGGGPWWRDVTPLLEQIAEAFRKVTSDPQKLAEVPN